MEEDNKQLNRAQLQNPLDQESKGTLKQVLDDILKDIIIRRNRIQITVPVGGTSFAIQSSYIVVTGGGAVTIATMVGGREGMVLTLEFTDANVTLSDDNTGTTDTINLSAAFTSTANDTIQFIHNGISWRELSRSVN